MNPSAPEEVPVLIVGGSLVGLAAAMFLGARGVKCMVVERHAGSSLHPRARGFTQRTLELFDMAGLKGLPEIPATVTKLRRVRTVFEETDPQPLLGPGHDRFGFSGWETSLHFGDLTVAQIH